MTRVRHFPLAFLQLKVDSISYKLTTEEFGALGNSNKDADAEKATKKCLSRTHNTCACAPVWTPQGGEVSTPWAGYVWVQSEELAFAS